MKANPTFLNMPPSFWAHVRAISETIGYTQRSTNAIKVPQIDDLKKAMESRGLKSGHLVGKSDSPTVLG